MAVQIKRHTIEEFDTWVALPENAERLFEFVGGEIVEVPSNPYSSYVASTISFHFKLHIRDHKLQGYVTGEAGGYMVLGERYAPDVAYISRERQPELPEEGYNPNPPDLAVEVVSPSDDLKRLQIKVVNYLAAGTVVWVVYSETREVQVSAPGKAVKIVDINGVLDGGDVLPGFTLPVKEIFPE